MVLPTPIGNLSLPRGILVIVNDALFNLGPDDEPTHSSAPTELPIRDDQVLAIREAFKAAGIDSQQRRQEIAQRCVVRPLASLRELTAAEAHRVLKRIQENIAAKPRPEGASAWDLREEDTWIDKL
jgi:hypothetical protein